MPLLVVGSVALDCVETPTAKRDDVLGGSAVFFSYAASFFSPVRMIGAVGEDWPGEHTKLLEKKGIEVSKIKIKESKTHSIENQLQNLAFKDPEIKYLGQRVCIAIFDEIVYLLTFSLFLGVRLIHAISVLAQR